MLLEIPFTDKVKPKPKRLGPNGRCKMDQNGLRLSSDGRKPRAEKVEPRRGVDKVFMILLCLCDDLLHAHYVIYKAIIAIIKTHVHVDHDAME